MSNRTGQTIQNIANILFYISVIAIVILGAVYWIVLYTFSRGSLGFLVCILIIGFGILYAYIYKLLMIGFGEIVEHQSLQTDLLRKMVKSIHNDTFSQEDNHSARAVGFESTQSAEVPQTSPAASPESQPAPVVQTATFKSRSVNTIVCTVCTKEQMSSRNYCYSCGCKFIYEDEL